MMRGEGANVTDDCGALAAGRAGCVEGKVHLHEPRQTRALVVDASQQHSILHRTLLHNNTNIIIMALDALKARQRSDYKFQLEYRTRWFDAASTR